MKPVVKFILIGFFSLSAIFMIGIFAAAISLIYKKPELITAQHEALNNMRKTKNEKSESAENNHEKAENNSEKSDKIENIPFVSLETLEDEYRENTVAADEKFKGKYFRIAGHLTDIDTDFLGNPVVHIGGSNQFMEPDFELDESDKTQLSKMKRGQMVKLICIGRGDVMKIPTSKCSLAEFAIK